MSFAEAIKNVCKKYSIPVFDNTINGAICWSNDVILDTLTLKDGCHLNEDGMEFVSYKYEQFLREI